VIENMDTIVRGCTAALAHCCSFEAKGTIPVAPGVVPAGSEIVWHLLF
jgi:hypothetical protein